jgi:hypothetical protein
MADTMNNKTRSNSNPISHTTPDTERIESLFTKIQPQPTSRFHKLIETQPWNTKDQELSFKWTWLGSLPAALVISAIVILVISLATPSLEALANRISQFFTTSSEDRVTIQIPMDTLTNPEKRFNLSISDAENAAGYSVTTPGAIPDGFSFTGAEFSPERQAITLQYETKPGSILRITQRPRGVEYQSISVNATVEAVQIGSVMGEYVVGGWYTVQSPEEKISNEPTITLEAVWNPKADIQFLLWQENDIIFEIIFSGKEQDLTHFLEKEDLILIAESIN